MSIEQLAETALAMVAPGKGIIAIDESTGTIKKRFDGVNIECTEENRRAYREMLLTTPNLGDHVSGAILFDETLRQSTKDGVPFAKVMMDAGVIPGIKVDKGTHPLAGFPGEVVTEGLDGLRDRLKEYYALGARFAKWRAVITIGDETPSGTCIEANSHALARYAALCQEQGLVPMVEPEVLMDGNHNWLRRPTPTLFDGRDGEEDDGAPMLPPGPHGSTAVPFADPAVLTRIKADLHCTSVAAASVIAKVERDLLMIEAADRFPGFGWEINKGYATSAHRAAIDERGPSDYHRRSWRLGSRVPDGGAPGGGATAAVCERMDA